MKTLTTFLILALLTLTGCNWLSSFLGREDSKPSAKKSMVEYTATLNSITLLKFAPGFMGDKNPDLYIQTAVYAETVGGAQAAIFVKKGTWPAGWEDIPVPDKGTVVTIFTAAGEPGVIFKHFGCAPTSQLVVTIVVGDLDSGLPDSVLPWLTKTGGIGGLLSPPVGPLVVAATPAMIDALKAEMGEMGQFPQLHRTVGPGAQQLKSDEVGGRQYEATIVVVIKNLEEECSQENLEKRRKGGEIAESRAFMAARREDGSYRQARSGRGAGGPWLPDPFSRLVH